LASRRRKSTLGKKFSLAAAKAGAPETFAGRSSRAEANE
jgi:hypothetical protein